MFIQSSVLWLVAVAVPFEFIVATTSVINGTKFVDSVADKLQAAAASDVDGVGGVAAGAGGGGGDSD